MWWNIRMKNKVIIEGLRDGLPIGLGYFAVAFSLGIVARNAQVTPIQGFIASILNLASAGEYALFTSMAQKASFFEIALTQKFDEKTSLAHRLLVGFGVTDEIFGISIARKGTLNPYYNYGAILIAAPLWSLGTALGIWAGDLLPTNVVSALSVALYGMFLAVIVPPAKKHIVIKIAVLVSFLSSYLFCVIPYVKELSGGTKTIILTVSISALLAVIKPVPSDITSNKTEDTAHE